MGTNYYAHIIPSKRRKKELIDLINSESNNNVIIQEFNKTYGEFNCDSYEGISKGSIIHLGKRSGGWEFLWNPNIYIIHNGHMKYAEREDGSKSGEYIKDPDTYVELYPLTKAGLKEFIDREDIIIYDEYGDKQDKEEFFDMAINWTTWNGKKALNSKTYHEQYPNEGNYVCNSEYITMLKSKGYEMISHTNSDFYSDGLRFASTNYFS